LPQFRSGEVCLTMNAKYMGSPVGADLICHVTRATECQDTPGLGWQDREWSSILIRAVIELPKHLFLNRRRILLRRSKFALWIRSTGSLFLGLVGANHCFSCPLLPLLKVSSEAKAVLFPFLRFGSLFLRLPILLVSRVLDELLRTGRSSKRGSE
jgi:hypothetical protein